MGGTDQGGDRVIDGTGPPSDSSAIEVMNLAELVQEHGGKSRSDAWYERVQRDDSDKHEVTLPDPIPVEIRP